MPATRELKNEIDQQMTETIRQLYDISSRIDERVKHLVETQSDLSDNMHSMAASVADVNTRLSVLEKSDTMTALEKAGVFDAIDKVDDLDKKQAVLEKTLNNGIRDDVNNLKDRLRTLELSNEHNTSFRTRGEQRVEFWFNLAWKTIVGIGVAILIWKMGLK